MCGIAGIYHFHQQTSVDLNSLQKMTRALAHRGPDGEGFWSAPGIGLVHQRLAIRDLSERGKQPLADSQGEIWITFNGEIYNDRLLRKELESDFGFQFQSDCDAELIPYAYRAWGLSSFRRLEGMYAIALWDTREKRLVLARDPIGIKPLYVFERSDALLFSSEIKSFFNHPFFKPNLQLSELREFVTNGYITNGATLLEGVKAVPPGTLVTYQRNQSHSEKIWQPFRRPDISSSNDAIEELSSLWEAVITDHLQSDVPIGICQSGGIDSSLVSAEITRQKKKAQLFTLKFTDASYDESHAAQDFGKSLGLQPIIESPSLPTEEAFRRVVRAVDGHLADSSAINMFHLCGHIRKHVKVALSGDGGDEFFGGYQTYRASRMAGIVAPFLPVSISRMVGNWCLQADGASTLRFSKYEKIGRFFQALALSKRAFHAHWRRLLPEHVGVSIFNEQTRRSLKERPLPNAYETFFDDYEGDLVDQCLLADQIHYLPADLLHKVDATSMAHGLEMRVPFLDRRIMEFAGRLSLNLLTPFRGPEKQILRLFLKKYGVEEKFCFASKQGFQSPIARYLREDLYDLANFHFTQRTAFLGNFFDMNVVQDLWGKHLRKKTNYAYILWVLLTLSVWSEEWS